MQDLWIIHVSTYLSSYMYEDEVHDAVAPILC